MTVTGDLQTEEQRENLARGRAAGTAASHARLEARVREWVFLRYVCGLDEPAARARLHCADRQVFRYRAHLAAHPELLADELSNYFGPESVERVVAGVLPAPPAG